MPRSQANLLLLLVAIIWGSTFVVQKLVFIGDSQLGLFTFTALRFGLGALVVVPFALHESANASEPLKSQTFAIFACIGAVLFGALITQQSGINRTSVTNAGFLTGLYVVIVTGLALVLFRKRAHWLVCLACIGWMYGWALPSKWRQLERNIYRRFMDHLQLFFLGLACGSGRCVCREQWTPANSRLYSVQCWSSTWSCLYHHV